MADEENSVELVIGADLTPLASGLAQAEAALEATGATADVMNAGIAEGAKTAAAAVVGIETAAGTAGASLAEVGAAGEALGTGVAEGAKVAAAGLTAVEELTATLAASLVAAGEEGAAGLTPLQAAFARVDAAMIATAAESGAALAPIGERALVVAQEITRIGAASMDAGATLAGASVEAAAALTRMGAESTTTAADVAIIGLVAKDLLAVFGQVAASGVSALAEVGAEAKVVAVEVGAVGASAVAAGTEIKTAGTTGAAGLAVVATEAKTAETSIAAMGASAQSMGAMIAAMGLGEVFHLLSEAVKTSLEAFGTFEATLNTVRAVTGATAEQMEKLRAEAILMGQVTQYSANEAAAGMVRLAKDGFDTEQIIAALPPVLNLAAAATTSVDEAAKIAAGSLRSFGLEAAQMSKVADIMAKAVTSSGMSLTDMGESIKVVGPIAHATGQSFLDMSTELAVLGKDMILGSMAANGLQGILVRLAAPPKDCAKALEALHISITDTNGAMLPLNQIIDQLREKTEGMTNTQKSATLSHIAGRYALKDLLDLVDAAPDAFDKMKTKLDEQGASSRIAKTQMEGLNGAIKLMTSSIETAEKVFGEKLAPAAEEAAHFIQHLADAASSMPPVVLELGAGLIVGAAAFAGLGAAAAAVLALAPFVVAGAEVMGTTVGALAVALGIAAAATGTATTALSVFGDKAAQTAIAISDQRDHVEKLSNEYETLKAKTAPTADEQQRMHDILAELVKISPDLVAGFDAQGNATDVDTSAIGRWCTAAERRLGLMQETARQAAETSRVVAAQARIAYQDKQQDIKHQQADLAKLGAGPDASDWAKQHPGQPDPTAGFKQQADPADVAQRQQAIANAKAELVELAKEQAVTQAAVDAAIIAADSIHPGTQLGPAIPPPLKGDAFVAPPGAEHKGKKEASTAASDASAISAAQQQAKAVADAIEHVNEAAATQETAREKQSNAQQLRDLEALKTSETITVKEYNDRLAALKADEINIAAGGELEKIALKRQTIADEIAQDERAVAAAEALDTKQGTKTAAAEYAKLAVKKQALAALDIAYQSADEKRQADLKANADKNAADDAKADADYVKAKQALADTVTKIDQQTAEIEAKSRLDGMGYFDRWAASAADAYAHETAAAQDAYNKQEAIFKASRLDDEDLAAARLANSNRLSAALAAAGLKEQQSAVDLKATWVDTMAGMGEAIANLAFSPSWANLDAAVKKIFGDTQQIKNWAQSVEDAVGAATGLDTGIAKGFGGVVGSLPIIGAAVSAMGAFKDSIDKANESAKNLAQGVNDMNVATAIAAANQSGDPAAKQAAAAAALANDTQKQYDAIRKQIQDARGPLGFLQEALPIKFSLTPVDASSDPQGAVAALQNQYTTNLAGLNGKTGSGSANDQLKAANDKLQANLATARENERLGLDANPSATQANAYKAQIGALEQAQQAPGIDPAKLAEVNAALDIAVTNYKIISATAAEVTRQAEATKAATQDVGTVIKDALGNIGPEIQAIADAQAKIDANNKTMATGGLDAYGNQISLIAAAQNAAAKVAEDAAKAVKGYNDAILQDQLDITAIETKRAADVLAIQSQGIAVRALSEFQTKTAAIAAINTKAAADTAAKNDDIAKQKQAIVDANRTAIEQESSIAKAQERQQQALLDQNAQQQALIEKSRTQLEIDLVRLATAQAMAALGVTNMATSTTYSPSSSSSSDTPNANANANGSGGGDTSNGGANYFGSGIGLADDGSGYQAHALGGRATGGTPGKDSIPSLLMPDEEVLDVSLSKDLRGFLTEVSAAKSATPAPNQPVEAHHSPPEAKPAEPAPISAPTPAPQTPPPAVAAPEAIAPAVNVNPAIDVTAAPAPAPIAQAAPALAPTPVVNVAPPAVNVAAPVVDVSPTPAPTVNIAAPVVGEAVAPVVNLPAVPAAEPPVVNVPPVAAPGAPVVNVAAPPIIPAAPVAPVVNVAPAAEPAINASPGAAQPPIAPAAPVVNVAAPAPVIVPTTPAPPAPVVNAEPPQSVLLPSPGLLPPATPSPDATAAAPAGPIVLQVAGVPPAAATSANVPATPAPVAPVVNLPEPSAPVVNLPAATPIVNVAAPEPPPAPKTEIPVPAPLAPPPPIDWTPFAESLASLRESFSKPPAYALKGADLADARSGGGGSSTVTINLGGITVNAGTTSDPRTLARQLAPHLDAALGAIIRTRGGGRLTR